MIGIDSNILLRYIAQDDTVQTPIATAFMESLTPASPGVISLVSIIELYWVLDHVRKTPRNQIVTVFASLLNARELRIENTATLQEALSAYASTNVDFDDCVISSTLTTAGCNHIFTFDKKAAKAFNMKLLT